MVPEKRAEQERADYAQMLTQDLANLTKYADTPDKQAALVQEFARSREGFRAKTLAYLAAKSRCMSAMITGPANFPTSSNRTSVGENWLPFTVKGCRAFPSNCHGSPMEPSPTIMC